MRTCAHCAILCIALACTEEDCVIHTIVLLRRVGGTQKEILRNDRANKSNDVTPTMKRVTSLTQKHITLWKFVITQGVFQHSQFSVCVRTSVCACFISLCLSYTISHNTSNGEWTIAEPNWSMLLILLLPHHSPTKTYIYWIWRRT